MRLYSINMPKRKRPVRTVEEILTLDATIEKLQDEMQSEVVLYNEKKSEVKKHYTKIHQLWGALDVLKTLSADYDLVPKDKV